MGETVTIAAAEEINVTVTAGVAPVEINALSDVTIDSVQDSQYLIYNSTTSQWENNSISLEDTDVSTSGGVIYVYHSGVAGTSRPGVSGIVLWIGSVEPTNSINNDLWVNTV